MFFKKRKGYALLNAVIASILMVLVSKGLATHSSSHLATLSASRTGMYTQSLAISKSKEIELTNYSDAASVAEARTNISGTIYDREVIVGSEVDLGSNNKKRDITVNVYKSGENAPREANIVTLTSQGSSGNVPSGTILAWFGSLSNIPSGFSYCDGSNGTPDLRGRSLIGTGSWVDTNGSLTYNLGDVGGERLHSLTITEMPSHSHPSPLGDKYNPSLINSIFSIYDSNANHLGSGSADYDNLLYNTGNTGGNQPHNVMNPYMAVNYIMKL